MIDPITALAAVSAIWSGIKKAVEVGREIEDVWGQLTEWAHAVDNLEQAITAKKNKPPLFKKLQFKDDAAEAMAILQAEHKLREMRSELRERFLYGDLEPLGGLDALRRFYQLQRQIRESRIRELQDQQDRRKAFVEACFTGGLIIAGAIAVISILWMTVELINMGAG